MENRYLKVEGDQYVKDKRTNALLTVNRNVLIQNEARKKLGSKLNDNNHEINSLKTQVNLITNDIAEIKFLLRKMIENKD
jgi:hypothetical protein